MSDLGDLLRRRGADPPPGSRLRSATARPQGAGPGDVLFYRLGDGPAAERAFRERLAGADPGLLVVNRRAEGCPPRTLVLGRAEMAALEREVVDLLYPPPPGLKLAGVTGTNGKTSVVWILGHILGQKGVPGATLGTLGLADHRGRPLGRTGMTTPALPDLRRIVHSAPGDFLALEASGHGLDQGRLGGLVLDAAGWTNLSREHLDYHGTVERCFEAKRRLAFHAPEIVLPRSQDALAGRLRRAGVPCRRAPDPEALECGGPFRAGYERDNAALAWALAEEMFPGVGPVDWGRIPPPPGRFETAERGGRTFVVDYAHTPAALRGVLAAARERFPGRPLWVVFGCGGGRDRGKRAEMGQAAAELADGQVLTSDNPRFEDPEKILDDIQEGCPSPSARIADRGEAIRFARVGSPPGAVVVVAGKGHEDHQEVAGERIPFDDRRAVARPVRRAGASVTPAGEVRERLGGRGRPPGGDPDLPRLPGHGGEERLCRPQGGALRRARLRRGGLRPGRRGGLRGGLPDPPPSARGRPGPGPGRPGVPAGGRRPAGPLVAGRGGGGRGGHGILRQDHHQGDAGPPALRRPPRGGAPHPGQLQQPHRGAADPAGYRGPPPGCGGGDGHQPPPGRSPDCAGSPAPTTG